MFMTSSIRETPNDADGVYAFHIMGEVSAEDMEKMSEYMNAQFDIHEKVSMLLIFDRYDGAESGATFNWESFKARLRSLRHVDRYAVVNAPGRAEKMVEVMGSVIPVETRAFDTEDEGWAFVGATALDRKAMV